MSLYQVRDHYLIYRVPKDNFLNFTAFIKYFIVFVKIILCKF